LLFDEPGPLLRGHREAAVLGIVEQCQDPQSQRWTGVPAPYTQSDARWFLDHAAQGWQSGAMAAFAVEFEGRFARTIDLRLQEAAWAEVGFGLAPWARGRHVMRRSLTRILNWAFPRHRLGRGVLASLRGKRRVTKRGREPADMADHPALPDRDLHEVAVHIEPDASPPALLAHHHVPIPVSARF